MKFIKHIFFILVFVLVYSCSKDTKTTFELDPSKPVEVGIESITDSDGDNVKIDIYMINHSPVAGIQFEINPNTFFEVDTVFGGRCESYGFSLRSNKQGRVLGFSMKGDYIPESKSGDKTDNVLFSILAKSIKTLDVPLKIEPIIASSDAKKMDFISIPFEK